MGSTRAQTEQKVTQLAQNASLRLKREVIQSLVELYHEKKRMDRMAFRDCVMNLFKISDDLILDRIYHTVDVHSSSQHLILEDFVLGMGSLLSDCLDDQIKFCFSVYDLKGDGYITRDGMHQFLKHAIVTKSHDADHDDADEGLRELLEMAMRRLDMDQDGRVSFEDYKKAVHDENLLLELLGQCLPEKQTRCQCLKILRDPDMNSQAVSITSARKDRHSSRGRYSARREQKASSRAQVKC
ncbi:hypothetical protein ACOMHN_006080 [Nucella lapillus]